MSAKRSEPTDPLELVGVELPVQDNEPLREMAATFAEEFARMGWGEERILSIFRSPAFGAPHRVWSLEGEAEVIRIVREALEVWAPGKLQTRRQA